MPDIKEIKVAMNGKLGKYYNLYLRTKTEKDDLYNHLSIRARIVKEKDTIPYELVNENNFLIENATIYIKIKDDVVLKKNLSLDFINLDNIVLGIFNTDIVNKSLLTLNIEAELVIDDRKEYLTTSKINTNVTLLPIVEERLFIDLFQEGKDKEYLYFSVQPTITPDFMEYKVNDSNWIKLDDNSFKIDRTYKNTYTQVRGKKNNYYSYSNVIKFIETRD